MNNKQVAEMFWLRSEKPAKSKSLFYETHNGYKLFSYGTVILQRFGKHVIGDGTKYSHTTSTHQAIAGTWRADLVLYDVPIGLYNPIGLR